MKMERTRFEGSNTLKSAKSRSSFLKSGCSCGGCCGYGVCGGAGLRALGRGRCGEARQGAARRTYIYWENVYLHEILLKMTPFSCNFECSTEFFGFPKKM